jgi:hypothetical protein
MVEIKRGKRANVGGTPVGKIKRKSGRLLYKSTSSPPFTHHYVLCRSFAKAIRQREFMLPSRSIEAGEAAPRVSPAVRNADLSARPPVILR